MATKRMESTTLMDTQNSLRSTATRRWAPLDNTLSSAPGKWAEQTAARSFRPAASLVPKEWESGEYRRATLEATIENQIAWSVRVNREERGLTQSDLAQKMSTKQPAISKLEDPEGGDVLVSTLVKAAHAFDCALVIRFVDYAQFARETQDVSPERLLAQPFGARRTKAA